MIVFLKAGGCDGAAGADSVSLCHPGNLLLPHQAPPAPRRPMSGSCEQQHAKPRRHQRRFGMAGMVFDSFGQHLGWCLFEILLALSHVVEEGNQT